MVLSNLLGQGDEDLSSLMRRKFDPARVAYAGTDDMSDWERTRSRLDPLHAPRVISSSTLTSTCSTLRCSARCLSTNRAAPT